VDILIQSRFRFPEFSGIASDWSVIVNSSHLENIRTWMRPHRDRSSGHEEARRGAHR
jgi:hypothetical protein